MFNADVCTVYDVTVNQCSHCVFFFVCFVLVYMSYVESHLKDIILFVWESLLILCHIFAKYFIVKNKKVLSLHS